MEEHGSSGTTDTKMIQSDTKDNPLEYLLSDSEDEEFCVGVICVTDSGSKCQSAKVIVRGVSLYGIVDGSRADITIMGALHLNKWLLLLNYKNETSSHLTRHQRIII